MRAVALQKGETVAVSAAAGGVGSLAAQLAARTGAQVRDAFQDLEQSHTRGKIVLVP